MSPISHDVSRCMINSVFEAPNWLFCIKETLSVLTVFKARNAYVVYICFCFRETPHCLMRIMWYGYRKS